MTIGEYALALRRIEHAGLQPRDAAILWLIREHPGSALTDLIKHMGYRTHSQVRNGTMRLAAKGFAVDYRDKAEPNHPTILHITEAGRAFLESVVA